jgi:SAM-dependent methyltransferase
MDKTWDLHYSRAKSKLNFPDENLVRILSRLPFNKGNALDFGAGSGRHSILLKDWGFNVTAVDYSSNSIDQINSIDSLIKTKLVSSPPYNFKTEEFDLLVNWGVLHYNSKELIQEMVLEFYRIIKTGGFIAGTIRALGDTHLGIQNGNIQLNDLKDGTASLFSLEETMDIFKDFKNLQIGYSERTPIGKLDERICHWIFQAEK